MTQPTVGRVVWFWPSSVEQLALPRDGQPLAAHVAAVSEDGSTVNLQVIDANGYAHARQNVPFIGDGGAAGFSYACWMPYQRAQHAKQEAATLGIASAAETSVDPSLSTTQAGPDTNYETVTTPSDGADPEFSNTSAN